MEHYTYDDADVLCEYDADGIETVRYVLAGRISAMYVSFKKAIIPTHVIVFVATCVASVFLGELLKETFWLVVFLCHKQFVAKSGASVGPEEFDWFMSSNLSGYCLPLILWAGSLFFITRRNHVEISKETVCEKKNKLGKYFAPFLFAIFCFVIPPLIMLVAYLIFRNVLPESFISVLSQHRESMRASNLRLVENFPILYMAIYLAIGPVVEEFIFRGVLFTGLRRRYGFIVSAGVSSLIYALAFYNPVSFLFLIINGIVAAYLLECYRSFWSPVIFHTVFNGLSVLFVVLLP